MDSISVKTTFKESLGELGIIFSSFSDAVREHPDLVKKYMGSVVLTIDSAKFVADPKALSANYAIPFLLTGADADTILKTKKSNVIGLIYENMLFGNYWHGGVTIVKDAAGTTLQTIPYYSLHCKNHPSGLNPNDG
jgi:alpha-beta hydrolase superfamily lysophospholipase